MKLTTAEGYALRAMAYLAGFADSDKTVSLSQVAEAEKLPFSFLEQLFGTLKKKGLVTAQRGAQGGYKLTKPSGEISVLEIMEAISGKISLLDCNKEFCPQGKCSVAPLLVKLQKNIELTLGEIKLIDLI